MGLLAKILIILGFFCIGLGILLLLGAKIPFLGKLPGDIYIEKKNFTFYFPLTTSLLLSIIISFVFWLISKIK